MKANIRQGAPTHRGKGKSRPRAQPGALQSEGTRCRKFGPSMAPKSTALRCAANMPQLHPPRGTSEAATNACPIGFSRESRPCAASLPQGPIERGATCVDEPLNNVPYRQPYPEIAPQLSVAESSHRDCKRATLAPALRRRWGRGSDGAAACSSRRTSDGLAASREVCRRRVSPGEGSSVLAACPISGEPIYESAALRAVARAHVAVRARTPLAPMGGASSRSSQHRVAAVGPGGCCGSPGTTKRRQGPPRACAGRCASGESPQVAIRVHVQRRRRRCRAWQRVRPPVP